MTNPDDVARIIVLLCGLMDHGGPFWCYVAVKPSQYGAFQAAQHGGSIDLYDFEAFGEVIVSGEGERPPIHVTEEVARMYETDARTFFRDIDPIAEIDKRIADMSDEPEPPVGASSWAARFGKSS